MSCQQPSPVAVALHLLGRPALVLLQDGQVRVHQPLARQLAQGLQSMAGQREAGSSGSWVQTGLPW